MMDPTSDPFGERSKKLLRRRARVLGGVFEFASDSRELMQLVDTAYQGLPVHTLGAEPPHFHLKLVLGGERRRTASDAPAHKQLRERPC